MHSNLETLNAIYPQDVWLCLAKVICGPVQLGCFIVHFRIQLSAAMLIIDAVLCDFEVEEKG